MIYLAIALAVVALAAAAFALFCCRLNKEAGDILAATIRYNRNYLNAQLAAVNADRLHDRDVRIAAVEGLRTELARFSDEVKAEQRLQLELAGGGVWTTQSGHKLRIRDMSTNHIENTLRMFAARKDAEPFVSMQKELDRRAEDKMWQERTAERDRKLEELRQQRNYRHCEQRFYTGVARVQLQPQPSSTTDASTASLKAQLAHIRAALEPVFGSTSLDTLDLVRQLAERRLKEYHTGTIFRHQAEKIKELQALKGEREVLEQLDLWLSLRDSRNVSISSVRRQITLLSKGKK